MVKNILIVFFIILAIYSLFRIVLIPEDRYVHSGSLESTKIKAENYLFSSDEEYAKRYRENILIGTSVSNDILMDSLPNITNLAFAGQKPYMGLRLIEARGINPKRIFVESNFLMWYDQTNFEEDLFDQKIYLSKKYIPIFREGFQPLAMFTSTIQSLQLQDKFEDHITQFTSAEDSIKHQEQVVARVNAFIENDYPHYKDHVTEEDKQQIKARMKTYLDEFVKRGVIIVFYETPVTQKFCESPLYEDMRKLIHELYPSGEQVYYMPYIPCGDYVTSDAVHLGMEERQKFAHFFRIHSDSIIKMTAN